MTLECRFGSFSTGTGAVASTVDVTFTSAMSVTPSFGFFFCNGRTDVTDAVGVATHRRTIGMFTSSTDRRCVAGISINASATMDSATRTSDAECLIVMLDGATVDGAMDLTSKATDKLVLDVTNQFATSYEVFYWVWGGSEITNATCDTYTAKTTTGTQSYTVTGSFQPDLLFVLTGQTTAAPPTTVSNCFLMLGAATGTSNQCVWTGGTDDGQATSEANSYCTDAEVLAVMNAAATSVVCRAAFNGFESTGFNLNYTEALNAHYFFTLAVKGGSWNVTNIQTQTDTSTAITISGLSFQPVGGLYWSTCRAESTSDTVAPDDQFSLGAWATNTTTRGAIGTRDQDNVADSNIVTAIEYDEIYANVTTGGAIQGIMDLTSINSDGVSHIMDDADPSAAFVLVVLGGNVPTASVKHLAILGVG